MGRYDRTVAVCCFAVIVREKVSHGHRGMSHGHRYTLFNRLPTLFTLDCAPNYTKSDSSWEVVSTTRSRQRTLRSRLFSLSKSDLVDDINSVLNNKSIVDPAGGHYFLRTCKRRSGGSIYKSPTHGSECKPSSNPFPSGPPPPPP